MQYVQFQGYLLDNNDCHKLTLCLWSGFASSTLLSDLIKYLNGHRSLGLLFECVFYFAFVFVYLFLGQGMSPHHSADRMSQRSQLSRTAL